MNINNKILIDQKQYYQNILQKNIPFTSYINNISNNIINNSNILNNDSENLLLPKRRSKYDTKGRTFICKICKKSYLSYPALYTHSKQKHNSNNITDRGRGRPKSKIVNYYKESLIYNPIYTTFFLNEEINGITEIYDFENCIKEAFNNIYNSNIEIKERNMRKKMIDYQNIYEHPFLGKFILSKHDRNMKIINENEISDIVFMYYLNMSTY